jgi:hypothetical protein
MEPSYRSFDETLAARLQSVAASLRPATHEELHALLAEIFASNPLHPWAESSTRFVQEHKDEIAYRAETSDGIHVVFYPRTGRGMWYLLDKKDGTVSGVGIISENNMKRLTQLVTGQQAPLA